MEIRSIKLKLAAVASLLLGMVTFSGSETVKGASRAIEKAGEGIQNSVEKHD